MSAVGAGLSVTAGAIVSPEFAFWSVLPSFGGPLLEELDRQPLAGPLPNPPKKTQLIATLVKVTVF